MYINELSLNIEDVINEFLAKDRYLLEINSSEQSISHKLAGIIDARIEGWDVDCEYNRNISDIKRLKYALVKNDNIEDRAVVPDIIVHHRGTNKNLLAIEVKKDVNKENRFKDHAKLYAFREQLGYKYTLFIDFSVGPNPSVKDVIFTPN